MPHAVWTPVAEADLDDVLYYIAVKDGRPETAIKIYHELKDTVDIRAETGTPAQTHEAAPDGWFYFQFKRWLIFYQHHRDGIEVMRVIDLSLIHI